MTIGTILYSVSRCFAWAASAASVAAPFTALGTMAVAASVLCWFWCLSWCCSESCDAEHRYPTLMLGLSI